MTFTKMVVAIEIFSDFAAGWFSGCCGLLVGHPLDTIKTRLQTMSYSGIVSCAVSTVKNEKVTGFYKGMAFPFLSVGLINSVYFGGYATALKLVGHQASSNSPSPASPSEVVFASCVGAVVQWIPACPIDIIKIKLQMQTAQENRSINFGDSVEAAPVVNRTQKLLATIFAGGVAGSLSWAVILPLDLVKSRIQGDNWQNPKYGGAISCAISSFNNEGLSVFYKGLGAVVLRAFPVNAVIFLVYSSAFEQLNLLFYT